MVIEDFLRSVGMFFDSLIYGLIGSLYELFMDISATQIFSNGTIAEFTNRVYALLAIFMLFKLSFSFLTFIINPDSASDKNSGAGKLIGNILITITLLITTPWLFTQVLRIQNDLLRDNIVGKIILGTKSTDVTTQLQAGDTMAWETFSAFFYPREDICENGVDESCFTELDSTGVQVSGTKLGEAYRRISDAKSVTGVRKNDLVKLRDSNDEHIFEYTGFVSLIAGGFIAYILLLFSIQIAVRTIKIGVLQLIAPIPIISYLDPKQGKDGMFKKWLKTCGKTFADLFIRLAAIYFAIFVITEITKGGGLQNTLTGVQTTGFAKVLVILGALTFAKDLPKFIEEITGIKLDGGFSLNPMKTLGAIPLVGGGLAAGAAFGFGAAKTGLWAAGQTAKAGIQTGAGKIFGNKKWTDAGQNTLRGINQGGLTRMNATLLESKGRFKSSGFAGTDKYSGDTRSSILAKEKEDLSKQKREAQIGIAKKQALFDQGEVYRDKIGKMTDNILKNGASANNFKGWRNAADFKTYKGQLSEQLANEYGHIYSSQEFANSAASLEVAKEALKYTEQVYSEAQTEYNAAAMGDDDVAKEAAAAKLAQAREAHNKQSTAVESMKENHKLMGERHPEDAKLESAIGVSKGVRPGSNS